MSTLVSRSKSATSASTEACHLGVLPDPALRNILQRACAHSDQADLANLLLSSKKVRNEVLACCKGLVQLKHTTAKTATEAEAFSQWLGQHGQLARSLRFCTAVKWDPDDDDEIEDTEYEDFLTWLAEEAEYNRALIEGAVAAGLQLAANNNSESAGAGLFLQACSLYDAGPEIAAVLRQLPASSLTSLQLEICQTNSSDDSPGTCLQPLCSSLVHLTNLKSLKLAFEALKDPFDHRYHIPLGVDVMIKQMSMLTNLTSLEIAKVRDGAVLEHLPASLQRLELRWADYNEYSPLSLGHLTALTTLEGVGHIIIRSNHDLPPNLPVLRVQDIQNVDPLLPLTKLKALTLSEAWRAAEANLQKLTALAALSCVTVGNSGPRWGGSEKLKVALDGLPNLRLVIRER